MSSIDTKRSGRIVRIDVFTVSIPFTAPGTWRLRAA
jgi:hypothetical protein